MDKLLDFTNEILNHMDNGDLMSCYSLFEAEIRHLLDDLDQEEELVKLWQIQRGHADDEDWAAVMEHMETIREHLHA